MKILVTTVPFGDKNRLPLEMLEANNIEYLINPLNKKLTENELAELITDFDALVAGTETISEYVMSKAPNLKMISRVGIGLDGIDLLAARKRGIKISYTPDAPAPAVAELTMGLMLTLLRSIHISNSELHRGEWQRHFGYRIAEVTIGIIGLGRIGHRILNRISAFGSPRLLLNDIAPNPEITKKFKVEWVPKETIYKESDLISLHIPLTSQTKGMIDRSNLEMMKKDAMIINTSRGGIINEQDLYDVMREGHLSGAAIDVFENEPYSGPLGEIERCILTAHMGSMSVDCRTRMEIEAMEEAIRFCKGKPLHEEVPDEEYEMRL